MPYTCFGEECAKPVVTLFTSLVTGETQASCADDLGAALIGQLAGWLGVDAQRLYDSVKRFADREAKSAAKTAAQDQDPAGQQDPASQAGPDEPDLDECADCGTIAVEVRDDLSSICHACGAETAAVPASPAGDRAAAEVAP